jgi:putative addiction module CopG family antidote
MPQDIALPEELNELIAARVATGRYKNAGAVMRAAMQALEFHEKAQEDKLARTQAAIDEGDAAEDADYSLEALLAESDD